MPTTYARKDPAHYAAQRIALGARVRDGMAVRAAARFLNIPYSTASLWAAQDGFRQADLAAEAAGAPRPGLGSWAKPGRGRRPPATQDESSLPPTEYPELKALSGRKKLSKLWELKRFARMRAVAAIEEGCISFGLASLREAQRLERAWRTLRDWLEDYPDPEDDAPDVPAWQSDEEAIAFMEGREIIRPPMTPEQEAEAAQEAEVWQALYAADEAEMQALGLSPDALDETEGVNRIIAMVQEAERIKVERQKYLSLPGRTPPPIRVRLPPLKRTPDWAKAARAPPEKEAFPIVFNGRRRE